MCVCLCVCVCVCVCVYSYIHACIQSFTTIKKTETSAQPEFLKLVSEEKNSSISPNFLTDLALHCT